MKKILRQGSTKKYRAKCNCCDTEFEYQVDDLVFIKKLNMVCVECPNCNILIQHKGNPSSNITTEQL
jgi:phage terminase large subunit GpA-like protein